MNSSPSKILATALLCSMLTGVKPISEEEALLAASTGGMLTGTAAGAGAYFLFRNNDNQDLRNTVVGSTAVLAGALSAYLIHKYLYVKTPSYAIEQAEKFIHDVTSDTLISQEFASDDDFIHYIRFMTVQSNPLDCAQSTLNLLQKNLNDAENWLNKACQGLLDDSGNSRLQTQYKELKSQLTILRTIIKAKYLLVTVHIEHDKTTHTTRRIMDDRLLAKDNPDELVWYAAAHFGTSWPLVLARDHFVKLTGDLETARHSLDYIRKNLAGISNQEGWASFLYLQEQHIVNLSKAIEIRMATIIQYPTYSFQVELKEHNHAQEQRQKYEKELEQQRRKELERQRQHEKEMLAEQQRRHERELEAQRRHEKEMQEARDRLERDKEEQRQKAKNELLQQALAKPNVNVDVSGNIKI